MMLSHATIYFKTINVYAKWRIGIRLDVFMLFNINMMMLILWLPLKNSIKQAHTFLVINLENSISTP